MLVWIKKENISKTQMTVDLEKDYALSYTQERQTQYMFPKTWIRLNSLWETDTTSRRTWWLYG